MILSAVFHNKYLANLALTIWRKTEHDGMVPRYYAAVQVPRELSQIPSSYFLLQWQKTAFAKDRGRFELGLHVQHQDRI